MTGRALLVAGTTSDAGKSLLTAGICRWLARDGVKVAPFKAQNMSNNSFVTPDGGEIGRAQALQAAACGLEPSVRFNPVLLKPGSDLTSQLVVLGRAVGSASATYYRDSRRTLLDTVLSTLDGLLAEYDVVVCEGAGSPTEINLRANDIVNMGLARERDIPTIVVGDIDRGGIFAAMFGTLALMPAEDQALVAGFVVNKFRGHLDLLTPGLEMLTGLTGRPVLGTLPWRADLWLDAEDALSAGADGTVGRPRPPVGGEWLRVAAVRLPRMSNVTDIDALACEPGVQVRLVSDPAGLAGTDLVVIPGSKSTVDDLAWLRRTGIADAVLAHHAAGRPLIGICGGFQMLCTRIDDDVESGAGEVAGLGVFPQVIRFAVDKTLARPVATAYDGSPVTGYEIHHGQASASDVDPLFTLPNGSAEGARVGAAYGTHWHGAFENDAFRRAFLRDVAAAAGRRFEVAADTDFAAFRAQALDVLGDLVADHLDTVALRRLIEEGAPPGLPFIPPGL